MAGMSLVLSSCFISPNATAGLLLEVDLTVENTISIFATLESSLETVTGQDFVGIYLADFYGVNLINGISDTLIQGDLVAANNRSDLSPNLFHFSNDPGLNIFSTSNSSQLSFTQGQQAFSGSGTWAIDQASYQHFLNSASSGNIFFAADEISDTSSASILGTWSVVDVPEPSILGLFAIGLFGASLLRRPIA